jgi:hypothetical protein
VQLCAGLVKVDQLAGGELGLRGNGEVIEGEDPARIRARIVERDRRLSSRSEPIVERSQLEQTSLIGVTGGEHRRTRGE